MPHPLLIPETGGLGLPQFALEKYQFWLAYDRRVRPRFTSSVVLLVENIVRKQRGKHKIAPLSYRLNCYRCRRRAERRGLFEREKLVVNRTGFALN